MAELSPFSELIVAGDKMAEMLEEFSVTAVRGEKLSPDGTERAVLKATSRWHKALDKIPEIFEEVQEQAK